MKTKEPVLPGRLADVDLRLLRVFKAVADCGGMAAAELELDIAMSTISRHVKDLEQRLGLVLCRRGRAGFALTEEGEQLHAAASQLLAATEAFRGSVHEIHQALGGELHVALFEKTATNPAARIAEAVAAFRAQAPAVQLHLHVGAITDIERGVMNGQFQLGVLPEHRRAESLAYDELFGETMLLYAGQGHPWFTPPRRAPGWAELREQPLAALGYHSPNMMIAHARRLQRGATASDQEAVATLVLSGGFVGFLPDHYAESFVRAGRLRAVSPQKLFYRCRFSAVRRRGAGLSRATACFRDALLAAHGAEPRAA
jgi:DNA-binding transcriptional LysR family regulator